MTEGNSREPMLDMFIFETNQLIEQLEQLMIAGEESNSFTEADINTIFRIMHTIKGSSAMMLFTNVADLAHSIEDLFFFIREQKNVEVDFPELTDLVLTSVDFIKAEVEKIAKGYAADGDSAKLIEGIKAFLAVLKENNPQTGEAEKPAVGQAKPAQKYYIAAEKNEDDSNKPQYQAIIFFEKGCEMENIRAFTIAHAIKEFADQVECFPEDLMENDQTIEVIRQDGFKVTFRSDLPAESLHSSIQKMAFVEHLDLTELAAPAAEEVPSVPRPKEIILEDFPSEQPPEHKAVERKAPQKEQAGTAKQNIISVNVAKLDQLMDIVGELVIAEAMVTQHPELANLELGNFHKAARQLHKITGELRDIVMSVRMMPLAATFQKMNRIVRDACKKTHKQVRLEIRGEETEVDKNIIEHISDPLMHLLRNSIDHGMELPEERIAAGKPEQGTILLEARNAGNDVWIVVKDDGRGLNKQKILDRARENGLITKPEQELTDKEIYSFICLPGFSTKEKVTEMSGRGVGMDVVVKNVEKTGGMVLIDSTPGEGTTISLQIPLTMAIIDGMTVKVGASRYTIPTTAIRESFRPRENDIITDPDRNEMLLIRGQCLPVIRLHEIYSVDNTITNMHEGIIIVIENDDRSLCLFADELIGQQQVVIKTLPTYIKKVRGVAGCTLLGDGNISLILHVPDLFHY